MPVELYSDACKEPENNHLKFGICDGINGGIAYTNLDFPGSWVATVWNIDRKNYRFMAIDNCIELKRKDGNMDNRCDCLLMYTDNIIFIELKEKDRNWMNKAILQLETTIGYYSENHDFKAFKHKRAYACNKTFPKFQYGKSEIMQKFFLKNRVRLNIQADIVI